VTSTHDEFQRVERLFREACDLPPDRRDAFLAESTESEPIREQVRSMLRIDSSERGVLDGKAYGVSLDTSAFAQSAPGDGPRSHPEFVGPYRIIRVLGEGGMGIVYEAEQDNPRRRVALKVLRRQWRSERLLRRFRLESEILGRLQHPGIAQILEARSANDDDGAIPFIAMEYVQGKPLLTYANDERLNARDRLALIASICDAVHHAHQHGVVHRDLKPANILVVSGGTRTGDAKTGGDIAQPKILDFGVSRLIDPEAQTMTLHTSVGELVGTVPYMSPEQAGGDPDELDWRSDVYSLGVILYELLTDHLPHDVRGKMAHEALRAIREDEPIPAGSVVRSLRGDVSTILAKALEKDKRRRYQSAAELGADIRRHLLEQPITARPASTAYRVRKFARRNKALVTGVGIAFAAMAIATVVSVGQAIRADAARAQEAELRVVAEARTADAERAREQSEAAYQFLAEMIGASDPDEFGKDARISDVLAHAASKIDERFPEQPSVRAHLRRNIGITYRNMGMLAEAEAIILLAVEDVKQAFDESDPIVLRTLRSAAVIYDDQRMYDKSLPMHREILAVQTRVLGPEHRDTLGSACNVGLTLFDLGRNHEAAEILEATLAIMRHTMGLNDRFTINAIQGVGSVRLAQSRFDDAEASFAEARDVATDAFGRTDLRAIAAAYSLGETDLARGRPDDALVDLADALDRAQSALPANHWRIGQIQRLQGLCLLELGRLDEAEQRLRDARAIFETTYGTGPGTLTDEVDAALARLTESRTPDRGE
jgi:serine/threonine protein kinase/tetratricopeptide (TPR) repeat protein